MRAIDEMRRWPDTFFMSAASDPSFPASAGSSVSSAAGVSPCPRGRLSATTRMQRPLRALALAAGVALLAAAVPPMEVRAETAPTGPSAGTDGPAKDEAGPPGDPAAPAHKLSRDKRTQLEGLFAALKVAPDEASAKRIGDRLDRIFEESGSPGADLLMARATAAMAAKNYDLALDLLTQVLKFEPDDLGALSRRATIYYMKDQYAEALADIREVLARESRHHAMLYAFALILRDIDEEALALQAVRRALAINPQLDGGREMEKQLALKVEGREI